MPAGSILAENSGALSASLVSLPGWCCWVLVQLIWEGMRWEEHTPVV